MKSEKDFLETMWYKIDTEQAEIYQEMMVKEENRKLQRKSLITALLFIITVATAFVVVNFSKYIGVMTIFLISIVFIILAYMLDALSFREAKK